MAEDDWEGCDTPRPMLDLIRTVASDRKLRLAACEFARRRNPVARGNERRAVELAERWADQQATDAQVAAFNKVTATDPTHGPWMVLVVPALESLHRLLDYSAASDKRLMIFLLREIFGNPFRPVAFAPEWRTSTAGAIAQQMYESRDFSAMPILADALQDAGCDSDEVLNHCRQPGEHVRGCWVVDLVLGRF